MKVSYIKALAPNFDTIVTNIIFGRKKLPSAIQMSAETHVEFVWSKEFQLNLMKIIKHVLVIGEGTDDINK